MYGTGVYLIEVIQSLMQVGKHASWRFVGDLNGCLQDALWYDVGVRSGCRLSADVHAVRFVALYTVLLQLLLQGC